MQITGNQVRGFRDARDLTQVQLAIMLGIHEMTISNWEKGGNKPIPPHGVDRFRGWYKAKKMGVPYVPPPSQRGGRPVRYVKPEIALEDVLDAAE